MRMIRIIAVVCISVLAVFPAGFVSAAPTARSLATPAAETLSVGDYYSCSLKPDNTLNCWGAVPPGQPAATTTFSQISAGGAHVCGIVTNPLPAPAGGNVECWGDPTDGRTTPPSGVSFTQISAGWQHTCGVEDDGTVACWGLNNSGQAPLSVVPPTGITYVQVTSGAAHSCALRSDQFIDCWGGDGHGQILDTPAHVADADGNGPYHWLQVDAGYFYTCALKAEDRTIFCWGSNDGYPLVRDSDNNVINLVTQPDPNGGFASISAGYFHACGLEINGHAHCWGYDASGEVDVPNSGLPSEASYTQISAGRDHTCALRDTGTWICWGGNQSSQLDSYTISGSVGTSGVTMTPTNGAPPVVSDSSGNYSVSVPGEWMGTVTPTKLGWTFSAPKTYSTPVVANVGPDDYTATAIVYQMSFTSQAPLDGWILESGPKTNRGASLNGSATTFVLGDDSSNRAYRAVLSFITSPLDDNAVITSAQLMILKSKVVGSNPFNALGTLLVDIRNGPFNANSLQLADFNSVANQSQAGSFSKTPVSGWYTANLTSPGLGQINRSAALGGLTQLRLRFSTDNNKNRRADYMSFFSGNISIAARRPVLVVTYTLP